MPIRACFLYAIGVRRQFVFKSGIHFLSPYFRTSLKIYYVFNTPQSLLWGILEPPFEKGVWGIIMLTEWNWVRRHILSIKSDIIL